VEQYRHDADGIIIDAESIEYASELVLIGKEKLKNIDKIFDEPIAKAYELHRSLTGTRNKIKEPIDKAVKALSMKISTFLTAQEMERKREQERLDAARRAAEAEERERLRREAAEAEKAAAEAAKTGDEAAAQEMAAKAAELEMEAETVVHVPEIVQPAVEKTIRMETGTVSGKKDIEVTVTDMAAFLRWVAESGRVELVKVENAKVKALAKTIKQDIPGVKVTEIVVAAFRGR
jgi:hypothetical protein